MKAPCTLFLATSFFAIIAGNASAQGHYEATPSQSSTIERSSEHKTEDRPFEMSVSIPMEFKSTACEAKLNIEYFQRGDNAEVSSTLTNAECDASFGSYTVQLRYRGEGDELETVDYDETWQRDDTEPVVASRQYFIGENVDLVRVKSRSLTCTCVDEAVEANSEKQ
jgi:hypothetical protein